MLHECCYRFRTIILILFSLYTVLYNLYDVNKLDYIYFRIVPVGVVGGVYVVLRPFTLCLLDSG